jgi:hypothetical protein
MVADEKERMTVDDIETEANPSPGESIFDQFQPEQALAVKGPDGLAVDKDPPWTFHDALPPPLTPKTMACLAQPKDDDIGRTEALVKCRYYKRQRHLSPRTPDVALIDRFCAHPEQRGLNGACMLLKDAAIFQCEFREPADPSAELILDAIDVQKIEIGEQRLIDEGRTGPIDEGKKVVGYRMFKTMEDLDEGRTTLAEEDYSEVKDD